MDLLEIKTSLSSLKLSTALLVPIATQSNGFSAIRTGIPVSLLINLSRSFNNQVLYLQVVVIALQLERAKPLKVLMSLKKSLFRVDPYNLGDVNE